jgi:hypothetical protein
MGWTDLGYSHTIEFHDEPSDFVTENNFMLSGY